MVCFWTKNQLRFLSEAIGTQSEIDVGFVGDHHSFAELVQRVCELSNPGVRHEWLVVRLGKLHRLYNLCRISPTIFRIVRECKGLPKLWRLSSV